MWPHSSIPTFNHDVHGATWCCGDGFFGSQFDQALCPLLAHHGWSVIDSGHIQ
jgi:hypothetical protein